MKTQDVAIHLTTGVANLPHLHASQPPLKVPFVLARDLSIERIPQVVGERILDMGYKTPFGTPTPARQFGQLYAFVRTMEGATSTYEWDEDSRLQTAIALSRLVRPTSISLWHAARIRYGAEDTVNDIFPFDPLGVCPDAFLADPEERDWLIQEDAEALRNLIASFDSITLPARVSRALWHNEYAARTYYVEVRWVLVATAIESLIHTDKQRSTAQFTKRSTAIAAELGMPDFTNQDALDAYDLRSRLSHGQGLSALTPPEKALYSKMERVLRTAILKCITDSSFRAVFTDEGLIRSRWTI